MKRLILALVIALDIWFVASWVDVVMVNNDAGKEISSWNFVNVVEINN